MLHRDIARSGHAVEELYESMCNIVGCFMLLLAINLANVLTGHDVILSFSSQNGTNEKF